MTKEETIGYLRWYDERVIPGFEVAHDAASVAYAKFYADELRFRIAFWELKQKPVANIFMQTERRTIEKPLFRGQGYAETNVTLPESIENKTDGSNRDFGISAA